MIFDAKIVERKLIAKNTWEISISHTEDNFYFNSGQYVWIITPFGRKAYSITSSSKDPRNFQIILKENQNSEFKKYLLDSKNSEISIRGPFGFLKFIQGEKAIYIAGGVGIAPFLSILRRMYEDNIKFDFRLIFACHTKEEQFYIEELKKIMGPNLKNVIGKITKKNIEYSPSSKYYVIGSQGMVDGVSLVLKELGVKANDIVFEENYPSCDKFNFDSDDPSYFKLIVDQSPNHIVITDVNGFVIYANASAERMTGYSFEEMKGQTPRLWGGMMEKVAYEAFWKLIKIDKKPFNGELRNQRKNGEIYDVLAMVSPIIDKDGKLIGFLGNEQDITQAKLDKENSIKINNLMVDRELKMVELKKKIDELMKEKG